MVVNDTWRREEMKKHDLAWLACPVELLGFELMIFLPYDSVDRIAFSRLFDFFAAD